MKKFFLILILWIFIISANKVFALSYKDFTPTEQIYQNISKLHKEQAKLLQWHILRYTQNITIESQRLGLVLYDDIDLQKSYKSLLDMKNMLSYIEDNKVIWSDTWGYMNEIIQDLKKLNTDLKIYFEQRELELVIKLQNEKKKYTIFVQKLDIILEDFISKLTKVLIQQDTLSPSEKEIVRKLILLNQEKNELSQFWNTHFDRSEDMRKFLREKIKNIQEIIFDIKNLAR